MYWSKNIHDAASSAYSQREERGIVRVDMSQLYEAYLLGCEDECIPEPKTIEQFSALWGHDSACAYPRLPCICREELGERGQEEAKPRIYAASRASLPEYPAMWKLLRSTGINIVSTWIDEADPGASTDLGELWHRIAREIESCDRLVLYVLKDDFPLKGALIEVGIAIGLGKQIRIMAPGVKLEPRSFHPLGSWVNHPLVKFSNTIEEACGGAAAPAPTKETHEEDCPCWGDSVEHSEDCRNCTCEKKPANPSPTPWDFSTWGFYCDMCKRFFDSSEQLGVLCEKEGISYEHKTCGNVARYIGYDHRAVNPEPSVQPSTQCWHKEIKDDGICKACGAKAAIKLPFSPEDVKTGRVYSNQQESGDVLRRISHQDQASEAKVAVQPSTRARESERFADESGIWWRLQHISESERKNVFEFVEAYADERLAQVLGKLKDREWVGRIMHESWSRTKREHRFHGPHEECRNSRECPQLKRCGLFHADLVPWEQLPEAKKDINRKALDDAIRSLVAEERGAGS